jgi:hypothetical protein
MKTRLALMLAVVAGTAAVATAQTAPVGATVNFNLSWTNSVTGDQTPLSPGQSANLVLTATMAPAVNTVVTVAPGVFPSNNTQGTLRGIQSIFLDLHGTNNAAGTWTNNIIDEIWDLVGPGGYGTPFAGGAELRNIQAGQFPPSWGLVNTTNPVVAFWTGTWTPDSYDMRTVNFTTANGNANPQPWSSNVLVRDATFTAVTVGGAANDYKNANIPIIPAPSSLALLGLGGLVAARRRR